MLVLSVILGPLVWATLAVADGEFRCTEAYCKEYIEKTGCPTLPKECNKEYLEQNPGTGLLMPSPTVCNCCEFCITYLEAGAECVIGKAGQPVTSSICGRGLMCLFANPDDETATCNRLVSPCMDNQLVWDDMRENGTLGSAVVRPECDERGDYKPAHCVPGATCYCVSPTDGTRIFGEAPYKSTATPNEMMCPCSVALWKANQVFEEEKEGIRCLPDGRYDPLQCVDDKCFCIDIDDATMTGKEFVHIYEISEDTLPCFDPDLHTERKFFRPCQGEKFAVQQELELLMLDGVFGLGLREPNCDEDGHYSPLQELETTKLCVDPDNELIEQFQVSKAAPEVKEMDCKCARTRWLMIKTVDESHVTELPTCCTNGNFAAWQCRRGSCYCVDRNGDQVGRENRSAELLDCYDPRGECALYGVYTA